MAERSAHIFEDIPAKRKAQAQPDDRKKLKAPLPAAAGREDAPDAEAVTAKEAEGGLEEREEVEEEGKKGVENCDESDASDEESDGPYGDSEEESDEDEDEDEDGDEGEEGDGSLDSEGDSSDGLEGNKGEEELCEHPETSPKGKAPVSEGERGASKGLSYNGKGEGDTKGKGIVEDKGKGKRVEDESDKLPSDDDDDGDDGGDLSDDPLYEIDPGNILPSRFRRRSFQPLHFNAGKFSGNDDTDNSDA